MSRGLLVAVMLGGMAHSKAAPPRTERLLALARLDAAVHYFDPAVATNASRWDSVFAANAVRIAHAGDRRVYEELITAMMRELASPAHLQNAGSPHRALVYDGFPNAMMQSSGGYGLRWRGARSGETYRVDMGEGVHVDVPISEPNGDTTEAVAPVPPPTSAEWRAAYPSAGYRILAAARIWSTIEFFYPYKRIIGENWEAQLRAALPELEHARDSLEYVQAVARFAAHIHDTHVTVASPTLRAYLGAVPIGAAARFVENRLVITRIADASANAAGLRLGDVVVSVDGEPIERRVARLTPFLAVSTPQSLHFRLESMLLSGPDATPARLVVRGASGGERTLVVPRSRAFAPRLQKHRSGNIIRILPGNIGYVDLDRLSPTMVDSAFRVLANAKAIVFDDRGYPLGTAWSIAPRLNTHPEPTVAARFRRLVVRSPDTTRTTVYEFNQPIPLAQNAPKYSGRTVMLIDERTISQAEHTGLFFEAANGTMFIGSPTMGANGDVTIVALPGGLTMTFTGHDVRHADGRQLQRVGLEPRVAVTPTITGIRAGRDEVLEAASRYVGGRGEIPPDTAREAAPVVLASLPDEPPVSGWQAGGTGIQSYRVGVDRNVSHGGTSSGHVTARTNTPEGFATVVQMLRADTFRGKRIRFSAFVKTRSITEGAGLWMRVDGNGGAMAFDNMMNRSLSGTSDWTHLSIVLDVPSTADGLSLGLLVRGGGEAWVDDASLEVVGASVPTTNMMAPSSDPSNAEQTRRMYVGAPVTLANPRFEGP